MTFRRCWCSCGTPCPTPHYLFYYAQPSSRWRWRYPWGMIRASTGKRFNYSCTFRCNAVFKFHLILFNGVLCRIDGFAIIVTGTDIGNCVWVHQCSCWGSIQTLDDIRAACMHVDTLLFGDTHTYWNYCFVTEKKIALKACMQCVDRAALCMMLL